MNEQLCRDTTLNWIRSAYQIRLWAGPRSLELVGDYGPITYDHAGQRYYFRHTATAVLAELAL